MKKLFSMLIVTFILIGIFSSCNSNDTDTNSKTDNSTDISLNDGSDISNDSSIDINSNINSNLHEKHGNKVYIGYEEKDIYYPEIREYEEVSDCFDIPLGEDGLKKVGAYLKFIETYDELSTYIIPTEFDSSILDLNYVVCVKQFFYDDTHEKRLIGYYDLIFSEGKYNICLDYYKSEDQVPHEQPADPYVYTSFIVVPKNSVEYTEQLQQITVNGKNDIEDEIYADDEGSLLPSPDKSSHGYVTHNASATLPENPTAWVVEKGSELEKSFGLEYYNKHSKIDFRVVLYLPNEPKYDFIITEKEIKNGNLYLTVEQYLQYTNDYLSINDVKFYDLYIQDTSELAENFDVYILVKTVK